MANSSHKVGKRMLACITFGPDVMVYTKHYRTPLHGVGWGVD